MSDGYPIKLVRDRVSEIDTSEGIAYRPVKDRAEHIRLLHQKLLEEVGEYLAEPSMAELADIYEVLIALAIVELREILVDRRIQQAKSRKFAERGGFDDGVVMVTVEPGEDRGPSARERQLERALHDVRFHTGMSESADGTITSIRETVDRAIGGTRG